MPGTIIMRARELYENETHLECRVSAVHSGWVVGISVGVRLREKRTTTGGSVEDPYVPSPGAGQHTERWYTEETINSESRLFIYGGLPTHGPGAKPRSFDQRWRSNGTTETTQRECHVAYHRPIHGADNAEGPPSTSPNRQHRPTTVSAHYPPCLRSPAA